ncbi:MAG TPA: NADH-quinone oxidoreductase subunit NuoE [Armatimonadota bacterium]|nr:NADH-quinone oxidoreductase subunit NuoE [Armatimonadota bacterium]HOS44575.1 NADH-quinone oxidoreductase subunit NuoE [Armatimonadota bacterium]
MLTEQERHEIDEEVAAVRGHARAAVVEALKVVQRRRGWVSDDDLRDVAACLGMTPAEVDAVATFYNKIFRRRVGRHVLLICDSVSCWIVGYHALLEHLRARWGLELGATTADDRFTLLPVACLGLCEQAPAMLLDGELYGNLTPARLDAILATHE